MEILICIENCVGNCIGSGLDYNYNFIKGEKYTLMFNDINRHNMCYINIKDRTIRVNREHFITLNEHRNKSINEILK